MSDKNYDQLFKQRFRAWSTFSSPAEVASVERHFIGLLKTTVSLPKQIQFKFPVTPLPQVPISRIYCTSPCLRNLLLFLTSNSFHESIIVLWSTFHMGHHLQMVQFYSNQNLWLGFQLPFRTEISIWHVLWEGRKIQRPFEQRWSLLKTRCLEHLDAKLNIAGIRRFVYTRRNS